MPGETVFVEERPDESDAEGGSGEDKGEDAAAHGFASGIVVGEGAEADSGVAHSGRRVGEGEEDVLVEDCKQDDDAGRGDSRGLEAHMETSGKEARGGEAEGADEDEEAGQDGDGIHEA